jgi:hypothetical protein
MVSRVKITVEILIPNLRHRRLLLKGNGIDDMSSFDSISIHRALKQRGRRLNRMETIGSYHSSNDDLRRIRRQLRQQFRNLILYGKTHINAGNNSL